MSNTEQDDAELEAALEAQQTLVESCLPLVFAEYDEAVASGVSVPVVVLVDCEDEIGGEIARAWVGDDAVDAAIAEEDHRRESDDDTTVFARVVSFADAKRDIPEVFPYLAPVFVTPPTDGFLAISITAGGSSAIIVPESARE